MQPRWGRYVRLAEIVAVAGLGIFALVTYLELRSLRRAPVVLPNYHFEVLTDTDKSMLVASRGTWIAENGPREPLQTVTLECRQKRMECVESAAAIVFVGGKGLLEAVHTAFEVDRWTATEIVTKPSAAACSSRTLVLDLAKKRAMSRVAASEESPRCRAAPERTLELVAGYRAKAVAE